MDITSSSSGTFIYVVNRTIISKVRTITQFIQVLAPSTVATSTSGFGLGMKLLVLYRVVGPSYPGPFRCEEFISLKV